MSTMAESNGSSSPDPLVLPSSPLASTATRAARMKPLTLKSPNRFLSPSKSIVIDTPKRNGASPWRIKVTVEAQPRQPSPSRADSRVTSVLPTATANINSPGKRASFENLEENTGRRARRRRLALAENPEYVIGDPLAKADNTGVVNKMLQTSSISPLRQPPRRRSRMNAMSATSQRSKRLSVARDELDEALQDAVGSPDSQPRSDAPGDMTVSANEDFSMVSMESLLSTKNTSLPQGLSAIPENQDSLPNVSHLPSSPPRVQYPEISAPARDAMASLGRSDYDAMSWKPTGPALEFDMGQTSQPRPFSILDTSEGQQAAVNPDFHSQVQRPLSDLQAIRSPHSENDALDDDIWQEEASRSIDEHADRSRHQHEEVATQEKSPQRFKDLFADEVSRPPRPKIPRTWRRTSGHDFSYVDSPAHVVQQSRKPSGGSTEGSGVLTPPSTDEEAVDYSKGISGYQQTIDHSEFSQPDAVGTLFDAHTNHNEGRQGLPAESEYDTDNNSSDSGSSVTSPDAEDTGLFWQTNLPNVYRRDAARPRLQRQTAGNVGHTVNADAAHRSEHVFGGAKPNVHSGRQANQPGDAHRQQRKHEALNLRPVIGGISLSHSQSNNEKVICSPLRRSLLKSSKIPYDTANSSRQPPHPRENATDQKDSFESTEPMPRHSYRGLERSKRDWHNPKQEKVETGVHDFDHVLEGAAEEETEPFRSYEEHLNLDSPMKINVKFNDSNGNSSLLAPSREYAPLFDQPSDVDDRQRTLEHSDSPPTITLVGPKPSPPATNLLSRLSTTFWSAVIRPTGPTELLPQPIPALEPDVFPAALRTQLRNRYGVVSEQFPWSMAHIRTLHRMLNSRESKRSDTLVPSTGPLSPALTRIADTTQTSVTGNRFRFTRAHAYIVFAFTQVLVPQHVILAMRTGEVEWLGDALAKQCRGYYGDRHGDEPVWKKETHCAEVVKWVDGLRGPIGVEFVVRALGDVVWSNEQLALKLQK